MSYDLDGVSYDPSCADCGLDTIAEGEWDMVHDHVWKQAWGSLEHTGPGGRSSALAVWRAGSAVCLRVPISPTRW